MYDLTTGSETQLTSSSGNFEADIQGNKIVWRSWRDGDNEIYVYDISSGQTTQATTDDRHDDMPAIFGDTIIFRRQGAGIMVNYKEVCGDGICYPAEAPHTCPADCS